jgi:hypothetical protein
LDTGLAASNLSIAVNGGYGYVVGVPTNNTVPSFYILGLNGGYIQQLEAGGIHAATCQIDKDVLVGNELNVVGAASFAQGLTSSAPVAIYNSNLGTTGGTAPSSLTVWGSTGSSAAVLIGPTGVAPTLLSTPLQLVNLPRSEGFILTVNTGGQVAASSNMSNTSNFNSTGAVILSMLTDDLQTISGGNVPTGVVFFTNIVMTGGTQHTSISPQFTVPINGIYDVSYNLVVQTLTQNQNVQFLSFMNDDTASAAVSNSYAWFAQTLTGTAAVNFGTVYSLSTNFITPMAAAHTYQFQLQSFYDQAQIQDISTANIMLIG